MPTTGLISEIQRFSVHDGPGIRTTVFFKGCPLSCKWCHNPECISPEPEYMIYPDKCIGCGRCADGCFAGARVLCGKQYSASELMREVLRDRSYYGEDGGVTFSGGEPLMQSEFLIEAIRAAKSEGLHVALESSMLIWNDEVFGSIDYLMADVKILDEQKHKEYTGVSNKRIIENIKRANTLGIPIVIRTPVMVGVNDSEEEIRGIRELIAPLENVVKYELLPYHSLGASKYAATGRGFTEFKTPNKNEMEILKGYANLQR